jgi:SET domain-containing protein
MYIAGEKELSELYAIKDTSTGKGVFALKEIPPQTILMRVKGENLNFESTKYLGNREDYTLQVDIDEYILTGPPFCYVNHCCDPNAALDSDLFMYTLKTIKAGEQICWDYSTTMLERSWTMQCNCGSPGCRKLITDFDLLPQEIQEKYVRMGIVLPFILKALRKAV